MSVLTAYFDSKLNQESPVKETLVLVKKVGKDGEDIFTYEPLDGEKLIKENGTAADWSLKALLAAGINPASLSVSTGYATRLDGLADLNGAIEDLESMIPTANEDPVTE